MDRLDPAPRAPRDPQPADPTAPRTGRAVDAPAFAPPRRPRRGVNEITSALGLDPITETSGQRLYY